MKNNSRSLYNFSLLVMTVFAIIVFILSIIYAFGGKYSLELTLLYSAFSVSTILAAWSLWTNVAEEAGIPLYLNEIKTNTVFFLKEVYTIKKRKLYVVRCADKCYTFSSEKTYVEGYYYSDGEELQPANAPLEKNKE